MIRACFWPKPSLTFLTQKAADKFVTIVKNHYNAFYIPPVTSNTFTDSSSRYGSRVSKETLKSTLPDPNHSIWQDLEIHKFWCKPQSALSTGQRQLIRVALTLLAYKEKSLNNIDFVKHYDAKLLLDPLASLDSKARNLVIDVLKKRSDVVVLLPNAQVPFLSPSIHLTNTHLNTETDVDALSTKKDALKPDTSQPPVLQITDLTLKYFSASDPVLSKLNLVLHPRDRLHLQGPNGSGKTTLLALITGEHPLSFAVTGLQIFGRERKFWSTVELQNKIGIASPDLLSSFPRQDNGAALSLEEVIATGFDRVFCRRRVSAEQSLRIKSLLDQFHVSEVISRTTFGHLNANMQAEALLLRAIVDNPKLLLLDEAFVGLVKSQKERWTEYLHNYQGSVIWTGHNKEDLPWREGSGQDFYLT